MCGKNCLFVVTYLINICVFHPRFRLDSSCVLCIELRERERLLYMLTLMRSLRVNVVRVNELVPVTVLAMAKIQKIKSFKNKNVSVGVPLNFIKFKER